LRQGKQIADDIGATFVFATLSADKLPERLTRFLNAHNIHTLRRADLLK